MPVFRVEKNTNYTTMSNYHLQDRNLSLKAKGLLSQFLSLPDSWHYNVKGLVKLNRDGKAAIETALKELEQYGYVRRRQLRDETGHMSHIEYTIFEVPQNAAQPAPFTDFPSTENPSAGNPATEKPVTKNRQLLNTNRSSTKGLNTKGINNVRDKETRHKHGQYQNVLLSETEYQTVQAEFPQDYQQRIERLSEYIASTGKTYKSHLATIRSWARRDRQKPPAKPVYSHENYTFEGGDSL
ncbi:MAG: helix-turn-helix domain-containing protein [Clostridiales bacterium]|nr:helix-turn-helix domain-containing protein [Clostridiales bacterium]